MTTGPQNGDAPGGVTRGGVWENDTTEQDQKPNEDQSPGNTAAERSGNVMFNISNPRSQGKSRLHLTLRARRLENHAGRLIGRVRALPRGDATGKALAREAYQLIQAARRADRDAAAARVRPPRVRPPAAPRRPTSTARAPRRTARKAVVASKASASDDGEDGPGSRGADLPVGIYPARVIGTWVDRSGEPTWVLRVEGRGTYHWQSGIRNWSAGWGAAIEKHTVGWSVTVMRGPHGIGVPELEFVAMSIEIGTGVPRDPGPPPPTWWWCHYREATAAGLEPSSEWFCAAGSRAVLGTWCDCGAEVQP